MLPNKPLMDQGRRWRRHHPRTKLEPGRPTPAVRPEPRHCARPYGPCSVAARSNGPDPCHIDALPPADPIISVPGQCWPRRRPRRWYGPAKPGGDQGRRGGAGLAAPPAPGRPGGSGGAVKTIHGSRLAATAPELARRGRRPSRGKLWTRSLSPDQRWPRDQPRESDAYLPKTGSSLKHLGKPPTNVGPALPAVKSGSV